MRHVYAQQVLKNFNISMYSGDSPILQYTEDTPIFPLTQEYITRYTLHKHISISNKKVVQLDRYDDLYKLGFQISKRRVHGALFSGQKIEYFLIKNNMAYFDMGSIPPEHVIEYNTEENWVRLVGKNSTGKKVYLKTKRREYQVELDVEDYSDIYEQYIADISPWTYQEIEKTKTIPEIPLIQTDDGKIVCLAQTKDMPTIGIFGKKGMGKTLIMHMLCDLIHTKWKKRCFVANDGVSFQTKSWSLPWELNKESHREFIKWLDVLGHQPRPLPCVYLFPNTDDLTNVELEGECSYRITLPFKDIISNSPETFFDSISPLGESGKYLRTLIDDDQGKQRPDGLIYAKTIEDISKLINEQYISEQGNLTASGTVERQLLYRIPMDSVRSKLFNLLREIFNSKIFDVNTGIQSKWIIQMPDGDKQANYPWRAALMADLVPVLVTSNIRDKKYFPAYFRYVLQDLFRMQSMDPVVKKNEIELWTFIDEIHSLLKSHPILETFRTVNKEGRPNRMGFVYATQYFGDIPDDLQLTTDAVISFQQTSDVGAQIFSNFEAMKHQLKTLRTLPKLHAMVASASIPLVVYDTEGNREVVEDGTPFKGRIFPPISQHLAPKKEGI